MKYLKLIACLILICFQSKAIHFWQPYPVTVSINNYEQFSRLELSVYDSVTANWTYYNTPYFFGSIDTSNSSNSIITFTTYTGLQSNKKKDYGFIIYDPLLHQFVPRFFENNDLDFPGATLWVLENTVVVSRMCCLSSGVEFSTRAYIYDINLNDWMDDISVYSNPNYYGGLNWFSGGYITKWTDNFSFQPEDYLYFYHPPNHTSSVISFTEAINLVGKQDLVLCQMGGFLSNGEVVVSIYDPWSATWKYFLSAYCEYSGDESTFYLEFWTPHRKIFGAFDDSLHKWVVDTPDVNISSPISKDRMIAFIDPSGTMIHMQTYSPTLHAWVRDSVSVPAGIDSLSILKSTVHWVDNLGANGLRGYIDGSGWTNSPTPLQLNFMIVNKFSTFGKPLLFARSYSYGTDSVRFRFSDQGVSEYFQGSVWHQFKVNGSYGSSAFDSVGVCIETVGDSGLVSYCKNEIFSTCSAGGNLETSSDLICAQDTAMLVLSGYNGTIEWQSKTDLTNWVTVSGTSNDTIFVSPSKETYYRAKVVSGICPPSYSTTKIVKVVPTILSANAIVGDFDVCRGAQIAYFADSLPGFEKFIWHFPNGFVMYNDSTSFISGIANGNNGIITLAAQTICGMTTPTITQPIQVLVIDTFVDYNSSMNLLSSLEWDADSFQWLLCPSYAPIPGQIFSEFMPSFSGSYAVEVTIGDCKDTSGCWDITLVGQQEYLINPNIKLFPNPAKKKLNYVFSSIPSGDYLFKIFDIYGRIIRQYPVKMDSDSVKGNIDIGDLIPGLYFVDFRSSESTYFSRFLKE